MSPEAMELIQAMDKSLVTPARSESGFPGPLTLPVDISGNVLTGGFQAVCAGESALPPSTAHSMHVHCHTVPCQELSRKSTIESALVRVKLPPCTLAGLQLLSCMMTRGGCDYTHDQAE